MASSLCSENYWFALSETVSGDCWSVEMLRLVFQICLTTKLYFPRMKRSAAMRLFAALFWNNFHLNSWWKRSAANSKYKNMPATATHIRVLQNDKSTKIHVTDIQVCLSLFTLFPFQLFLFQPLCFPPVTFKFKRKK